MKEDVHNRLEILKKHAKDDKTLEKLNNFSDYLSNTDENHLRSEVRKVRRINRRISFFERFKIALQSDIDIDPGRLMGLTDGIFGMVMTLLVFGIALPEEIVNNTHFISFISTFAPTVGLTIVSFVLIASFWIYHHEFIKVKSLNIPYLWLNIMFLICISFIPFTTSMIGNYSHFFLSEVSFGLNIFMTSLCFILIYYYAYSKGFLEYTPSSNDKSRVLNTFFLIMAMTVIVNLLDYNISNNFIYLFLLVPVISTIMDIRYRMKK